MSQKMVVGSSVYVVGLQDERTSATGGKRSEAGKCVHGWRINKVPVS